MCFLDLIIMKSFGVMRLVNRLCDTKMTLKYVLKPNKLGFSCGCASIQVLFYQKKLACIRLQGPIYLCITIGSAIKCESITYQTCYYIYTFLRTSYRLRIFFYRVLFLSYNSQIFCLIFSNVLQ